ncbi:MAG: hypothetical protein RJA44_349, partial [Pseudomonadota bacterium]
CSVCHGDSGRGSMWASANLTPPPRDFGSAQARTELTRERMLASISVGRPGTAMPAFGQRFKPADLHSLVDHIRSRYMALPPEPAQVDLQLPLPDGLQGDWRQGENLYRANCVACHGEQGDGQGPRAYFIRKPPRNFISTESRRLYNRPALHAAISAGKTGTEMPAWRQVLSPAEIGHISEYVLRRFIAPDSATAAAADSSTGAP